MATRLVLYFAPLLSISLASWGASPLEGRNVLGWGGVGWTRDQIPPLTNIVQISCISVHQGIARTADGQVRMFGNNDYGQQELPPGLTNIIDVAGGAGHAVALRADGRVFAWGNNNLDATNVPETPWPGLIGITSGNFQNYGLNSDGTVVNLTPGVSVPPINDAITLEAGGGGFVLAIRRNGEVYAWGANDFGQTNVPPGLTNVVKVAPGVTHALALKADGTVVAWGDNSRGQCAVPAGLSNVVSIAAGTFHSLAVRADGKVFAWGSNDEGQLAVPPGYTDISEVFSTPVGSLALTRLPVLLDPPGELAVSAATDAALTIEFASGSPATVQWLKDGARLAGATNSTLVITNCQEANGGVYRAIVQNAFGAITSAGTTLTVQPAAPQITGFSERVEIVEGTPVTLFIRVQGSEPMRIQWFKESVAISGATKTTFDLPDPSPAESGRYWGEVENAFGRTVGPIIEVSVLEKAKMLSPARDVEVAAGESFIVTPQVGGTRPLSYYWFTTGNSRLITITNTAEIFNVQAADVGSLFLVVSNGFSASTNLVAQIRVRERPPEIISHPQDRAFAPGRPANLAVVAAGTEPLAFQWFKNGAPMPGETNTGLLFASMSEADIANYRVVVRNALGTVTSHDASIGTNSVEAFDWPSIGFMPVAMNSALMTQITDARDGTDALVAVEQRGYIRILRNGVFDEVPFLNITHQVVSSGERGLLSIAFAPDYESSRTFYTCYSRKPDGATVLARFKTGADGHADPASEQELLAVPQATLRHKAGHLDFGPDNYLYFALGDDTAPRPRGAQDPSSFLGKILRLDVSGASTNYIVPPDNPFAGQPSYRTEIWQLGLRNPWRFTFDKLTGDMFIADVGENLFEEIDYVPADSNGGQNFGWPFFEGQQPRAFLPTNSGSFTFPVALLQRDASSALIGGLVHRRATERLFGLYLSADYMTGRIWGLRREGTNWMNALLGEAGTQITSFGEDQNGNVYVAQAKTAPGVPVQYLISRLFDSRHALAPSFSPGGGTYVANQPVTLSSLTPGATIYYTLDGTEPEANSPSVPSGGSVTLDSSVTLKAKAVRPGLAASAVTAANYNFAVVLQFDPAGSITNGTPVSILPNTTNVTIWYTLDGSDPSTNSLLYTGPVTLEGNQTLKAFGAREGWLTQTVFSQFYGRLNWEPVTIATLAGTGQPGTNDGPAPAAAFTTPLGIAVASDNTVFVVDSGNHSLRKISGGQVRTVAANLIDPFGVAVDTLGNVYVSDRGANRIVKIAPDGTQSNYAGSGEQGYDDGPAGQATFRTLGYLEMDQDGNLYVTDWGNLRRISASREVAWVPPSIPPNAGLAVRNGAEVFTVSEEGIVYRSFADTEEVYAGSSRNQHSDGDRSEALFTGQPARDMAGDDRGNLFVADGPILRHIDSAGQVTTLLERPLYPDPAWMKQITGVAVGADGAVYVCDAGDHTIKKVLLGNKESLRIEVQQASGQLVLKWSSTEAFRLEYSDDLNFWEEQIAGEPGRATITPSASHRFFRVKKN